MRSGFMLLKQGLILLLCSVMILSLSACDFELGNNSSTKDQGGDSGGGFDGKLYVQVGSCPNSTSTVVMKIQLSKDQTQGRLLRSDCTDRPELPNVTLDLDFINLETILYRPSNTALHEVTMPKNTIQVSPTPLVTGSVGQTFNVDVTFDAVPMGVEGYQICLFMVDSSNVVPYAHNCFWPPQRSDIATGTATFTVSPSLPSGTPTGRYKVTASYVRFNGVVYQAVAMNLGAGVTQSPEVGAPFAYVIGEVDLN